MEIRPILSALLRSKVSMILIGLQVALTLAIVCNALFIIGQRFERMQRPSGMNETDTFAVSSVGFGEGFDVRAVQAADLALLRRLPGVVAATSINSTPLSGSGWSSGVQLTAEQKTQSANAAFYMVDDHGLDALGAKLIAGRNFLPTEVGIRTLDETVAPASIIISQALAKSLFPGESAVGKQIYIDDPQTTPKATIVGVVERLQTPWVNDGYADIENSLIQPQMLVIGTASQYLIRAEPGRRDEVMKAVETQLAAANPSRIVGKLRDMEAQRRDAYANDRAMAIILGAVIIALLAITALGIVGMASFWVAQRTRQIGTRRALGATRGDILRYFQTENFIITTLGLILGSILAYALSLWMMQAYQSPRLPWHYVPIGFLCLWALGQIAVLGPALRASRVPPAVATRTL
ncbi:FtsX-like permease family protein [Dokdonella sp.]|uniref:ABC transporter permease n=1 Tax=Dokdonella sp. TaxID=2291710 RepID=UPI0025B9866D|nr:FtsX-like permease family protein [Dokdonella sp.]MBX3689427.1 ABC transporter permease [Dokdonella sp.]